MNDHIDERETEHVPPSTEEAVRKRERSERRNAIRQRKPIDGLQVEPENPYDEPVPHRTPGDSNVTKFGFDLHPQVTLWSAEFLPT